MSDTNRSAKEVEGLGTAGTPDGGVLSIQGLAGMTPVTVTISGGGGGGTAQADESTFTEGTTSFTPIGGVLNDTITSDPTEDQAAAIRITPKRAAHINLRNVSGTEIGTPSDPVRTDPTGSTAQPVTDNGGSLTVDGTIAATQSGTWNITDISGTVSLPTGASTAANQATEITALQLIDDIVHSTNSALNKAAAIAGQLDDTTTTAATEDNIATVRITAQRALHTNLRNNSGTEIGVVGAPIRTDPTGTTAQPVTDNGSTLSIDDGAGSITVDGTVSISSTALTASSPTFATVGTSSAVSLASNANRKGLVLTNTSSNTISFGIGATAVLNSGITIGAGGAWVMDSYSFTTAAINAIASAASSNLGIQEFTT